MKTSNFTEIENRELAKQKEAISVFHHIKDLKEGDILRYTKRSNYRYPEFNGLVTVYSVLPEIEKEHAGSAIKENDFTTLILDENDNEIMEFALDSRYFEKVNC